MNKIPLGAIVAAVFGIIGAELIKVDTWSTIWTTKFVGMEFLQFSLLGAAIWGGINYQKEWNGAERRGGTK